MGEILGVGLTHYPGLIAPDEDKMYPLTRLLKSDKISEELKNPLTWPEAMRIEYGEDDGVSSAKKHRERLVQGFREQRVALDEFNPDVVLIWGDDQYENFKEDIIPPFCVLAYDQMDCTPFTLQDGTARRNVWNEPSGKVFHYEGHPAARYLVSTTSSNWTSTSAVPVPRFSLIGWSSILTPAIPSRMQSSTIRRTAMIPP